MKIDYKMVFVGVLAAILVYLSVAKGLHEQWGPARRARQPTVTEELGALIYFPPGHDPETPANVLYWLHGRNMTGRYCPPMLERPNYIIVSPLFDREARWSNYDLRALVARVELKYAVSERYLEGYSRGANGAVHHGAANPGMFAHINALAGSYVATQRVQDPLTILGGIRENSTMQSTTGLTIPFYEVGFEYVAARPGWAWQGQAGRGRARHSGAWNFIMSIYGPSYQQAREERLVFAGNRCEICKHDGSNYRLECHHTTPASYELGRKHLMTMKDVIILCVSCHDAITDRDRSTRNKDRESFDVSIIQQTFLPKAAQTNANYNKTNWDFGVGSPQQSVSQPDRPKDRRF